MRRNTVVFGPGAGAASDPAPGLGEETLKIAVRQAAGELVAALDSAQRASDNWSHEPLAEALVDAALSRCLARLAGTGCWGRANQVPSSELWKIAGERLAVGVLQERARTKPLGYAGDYQMLAWICRQRCCDDPLGKLFDRFFLRQAAPAAVRARTEQAAGAIAAHCLTAAEGPYHLVSVGVGPGLDVAAAVGLLDEPRRRRVRVTLVDLDDAGLAFAAEQLQPWLAGGQVAVVRENLFRLANKPPAIEQLAEADFLLCTGLCDYLDDEAAGALMQLFWSRLTGGGEMLVGNFAPHCPTRAYMEWIGNWYLNYRTADELASLARRAGLPASTWSIGAEPLGIDLFLHGRKPRGA